MLTLSDLSKSYGGRVLFEEVTLQASPGDRIGLVGPNGAGKSTLFSLILREAEPDSGEVFLQRNTKLGYLPQETAAVGDQTVLELACSVSEEFEAVQRQLRGHTDEDDHEAWEHLHSAKALFDELGGYQLESKAKKILAGLGFRETDHQRAASELSGGWIMRAHLARLLVMEPDLLMLDEPTNHLDLSALIWFQNYLRNYPGAILMISHDREFLNTLVTNIWELRQRAIFRYTGNYDSFLTQKAAQEAQQWSAYKNQQKKIDQLMTFVDRFRAKNTKAAQAQSKLKQIDRMDKIEAPVSEGRSIGFKFPQPPRSGQKVIALKHIEQAYGEKVVYEDLNFEVERGQRVVLVGPNGAGKSTLLKLLAGVIPFQAGERALGHNAKSGYFAQYRIDNLTASRTVLEEASDTPQRVTEQEIRTVLGSFLFTDDTVYKKVKVLSGGEKTRLALVKLLMDPPNLLLMDEPTTHLDMGSIDALIEALKSYTGTLVFISHDVHFIRAIATSVVHVCDGKLTLYPGDYDYFVYKSGFAKPADGAAVSLAAPPKAEPKKEAQAPSNPADGRERKRLEAQERQERARKRKELQGKVAEMERAIHTLENRQKELVALLEQPDTYQKPAVAMAANREIQDIERQLPEVTGNWERAALELETFGSN